MFRGGVLFVDSADKATHFIQLCDAFNVPLIFLADVPGFMVGTAVERQGIIRHGAKMITAVSEATVPKFCVVVRKAYGAGLYAMAGPGFEPDATLALPTAKIAVMGAEAAVNAVYANKIAAIDDDAERAAFVAALRAEYEQDIDLVHLAAELVVDAVVEPEELRDELIARLRQPAARTAASPDAGTASPRSEQCRVRRWVCLRGTRPTALPARINFAGLDELGNFRPVRHIPGESIRAVEVDPRAGRRARPADPGDDLLIGVAAGEPGGARRVRP